MKSCYLAIQIRRTWSKGLFATLLLAGLVSWTMAWSAPAGAEEKTVSEEILDILRDKGEISDQKYDELKKRAEAEKKGPEWKAYWKDGLRVERKDGKIKTRWGSRIMLDWANISAEEAFEDALEAEGESGPLEGTGVEFRRLRFFTSGTLYETMGYKLQVDLTGQDVDLKDAYIDFLKVPYVANNVLRIGHNKEPISLEELTSSKYITFMERALPTLAFAPRTGWRPGTTYTLHMSGFQGRAGFSFQTRPFVAALLPSTGQLGSDPVATIRLTFGYPVDPVLVEAALHVER